MSIATVWSPVYTQVETSLQNFHYQIMHAKSTRAYINIIHGEGHNTRAHIHTHTQLDTWWDGTHAPNLCAQHLKHCIIWLYQFKHLYHSLVRATPPLCRQTPLNRNARPPRAHLAYVCTLSTAIAVCVCVWCVIATDGPIIIIVLISVCTLRLLYSHRTCDVRRAQSGAVMTLCGDGLRCVRCTL